jgi:hypothetical protein
VEGVSAPLERAFRATIPDREIVRCDVNLSLRVHRRRAMTEESGKLKGKLFVLSITFADDYGISLRLTLRGLGEEQYRVSS